VAAERLKPNRRSLMQGALVALCAGGEAAGGPTSPAAIPSAAPISRSERLERVAKAQKLMQEAGVGALLIEPGSTMIYFSGVNWGRSERPTVLLLPAEGELAFVTPAFEESRLAELVQVPAQIRTWQEHEDPFVVLGGWMDDLQPSGGKIAVEDTVRFFVSAGLAQTRPSVRLVSGAGVVNACRMIKSPAEIALMQQATDIMIAAYRSVGAQIAEGMTSGDITGLMQTTLRNLGAESSAGDAMVGEGSSYPHGGRPEAVRRGSVVLMDFGCTVQGYYADVSRTMVFGDADARQRQIWNHVREGQEIAFEAARVGATAGSVDEAVRSYYEKLGYGPGYATPGLTHRTGHGIGLDVHEPVNFVRGERTPLAPGMCFSNEPGIYTPGRYGVRIEDCLHITERGPVWFSTPPRSIEQPFG